MKIKTTILALITGLMVTGCQSTSNLCEHHDSEIVEFECSCGYKNDLNQDDDTYPSMCEVGIQQDIDKWYEDARYFSTNYEMGNIARKIWHDSYYIMAKTLEDTKCYDCASANHYYILSKTAKVSDEKIAECEEHFKKCDHSHYLDIANYKNIEPADYICVECMNPHNEEDSYYNEDGMSACSKECFDSYTSRMTKIYAK